MQDLRQLQAENYYRQPRLRDQDGDQSATCNGMKLTTTLLVSVIRTSRDGCTPACSSPRLGVHLCAYYFFWNC